MNHLKKLLFYCASVMLFVVLITSCVSTSTNSAVTETEDRSYHIKEAKNALLIANGDYARDMGALKQPIPEARGLKSALESIGFNVTLVQNADRDKMLRALKTFKEKTRGAGGIAFFHYGGHAMQIKGRNYLIPLRATLEDEQDVAYNCVNVNDLMESMEGEANVVVLDSCRNNPFAVSRHRGADTRGLAAVSIKPKNSIIVYSASEGNTAQDGIFTPILTKRITEKNRTFYEVLQEVRADVYTATGGKQKPGSYDELLTSIYLAGVDTSAPTQQAATAHTLLARQENRNNTGDRTYRIDEVSFTMKLIAAVHGAVLGDNSQENNQEHTVNLSAYYIGETEVTQELWQIVMGRNPSFFDNTDNTEITEGKLFKVDRKIASSEVQKKRPIETVSWFDCIAFCNKLTAQIMGEEHCVYKVKGTSVTADFSKKGFRLPTEAEWEYAAMGGKKYRWAGTTIEGQLKNYAWYDVNSDYKTHEVRQKYPNGYDLYDMSGNVWEWCWDWYNSSTPPADQNDPLGALSGSDRVLRGGGWCDFADVATRAFRRLDNPGERFEGFGLRVACRP